MSREIKDSGDCLRLIENSAVGRLATCRDGMPYITPVHFVLYKQKIYIHTGHEGRKIDNIKSNPEVCFEVSEMKSIQPGLNPCKFSTDFRSVLIFGRAELIENPEEKADILNRFVTKYAGGFEFDPIKEDQVENVAIIEIDIAAITGRTSV